MFRGYNAARRNSDRCLDAAKGLTSSGIFSSIEVSVSSGRLVTGTFSRIKVTIWSGTEQFDLTQRRAACNADKTESEERRMDLQIKEQHKTKTMHVS